MNLCNIFLISGKFEVAGVLCQKLNSQLEFGEIKDYFILAVLYRIAKLTETSEYCSRHDIVNYYKENLLDGEESLIVKILNNLEMREVVEINEGMYRIQVKLFQKWILKKKTPETASLRELVR